MKPKAHPTKWTLVVQATMHLGKPFQLVHDYNTQAEAEAELAKAKDRGTLTFKASDRRHCYLSFKVERPIRANTKAIIQKRTTTCGSDHPSCSKW